VRKRLRPKYSERQLAEVYSNTYDHTKWTDHIIRVEETVKFASANLEPFTSIADLSCGDGYIATGIAENFRGVTVYLGDFVEGNVYCGPIEETVHQIPSVGAFVLSETLEHLDDPDAVLRELRAKTRQLVLSTPCDETIPNFEHYWAWSASDVAAMLEAASFQPVAMSFLEFPELDVRYQMWVAR